MCVLIREQALHGTPLPIITVFLSFFFFNLGISLTIAFLNLQSGREATIKVTITKADTGATPCSWDAEVQRSEEPGGRQVGKLDWKPAFPPGGRLSLGWFGSIPQII